MLIKKISSPKLNTTYTLDYNLSDFRLVIIETATHTSNYAVWARKPWAIYGENWYGDEKTYQDASIITENSSYYVLLRFTCILPNEIKITQKNIGTFIDCDLYLYGLK